MRFATSGILVRRRGVIDSHARGRAVRRHRRRRIGRARLVEETPISISLPLIHRMDVTRIGQAVRMRILDVRVSGELRLGQRNGLRAAHLFSGVEIGIAAVESNQHPPRGERCPRPEAQECSWVGTDYRQEHRPHRPGPGDVTRRPLRASITFWPLNALNPLWTLGSFRPRSAIVAWNPLNTL